MCHDLATELAINNTIEGIPNIVVAYKNTG